MENQELINEEEILAGYNDDEIIEEEGQEEQAEPSKSEEDLKAEIASLKDRIASFQTLEERLKQTERRIGGITNELSAAKKGPTQEEIEAAAKDESEWNLFKEEWPEHAARFEALESRLAKKFAAPDEVNKIREQLETDFNQRLTKSQIDFEARLVSIKHRGWQDMVKTPEFTEWAKTAPADLQEKMQSPKAEDAIDVFDAYKAKQPPKQDKNRRLEQAILPGKQNATRQKTVDDMTPSEQRAYFIRLGYKDDD
jgi:hypothetical protein